MVSIVTLFIGVTTPMLSAQQTDSISHKHLMIKAINSGNYDIAIEEFEFVENWMVDTYIEVDSALVFLSLATSNNVAKQDIDSLVLYVGELLEYFSKVFVSEERHEQAVKTLESQLNLFKKYLGKNDIAYAHSLEQLGALLGDIGKIEQAQFYFLKLKEWLENELGENNVYYMNTVINLALNASNVNNFKMAEEYYQEGLAICQSLYSNHHPEYIQILSEIGAMYLKKGDYYRAKEYFLESLEICKTLFGASYMEYKISMECLHDLGHIYYQLNDYSMAEEYWLDFIKAIEPNMELVVSSYPQWLGVYLNIGSMYHYMRDFRQSEYYYRKLLKIYEAYNQDSTSNYASVLHNLGNLYCTEGDYAKAKNYQLQALEIRKNVLGEDHAQYVSSILSNGFTYSQLGEYKKARVYYRQALNIIRFKWEHTHPYYITALQSIAEYYGRINKNFYAEKYYKKNLKVSEVSYGKEHPIYAHSLVSLGSYYYYLNDYQQCERYYLEALDILYATENAEEQIASILIKLGLQNYNNHNYNSSYSYFLEASSIHKNEYLSNSLFMTELQHEMYWLTIKTYFEDLYTTFSYENHFTNRKATMFAYDNELFYKGLLLKSTNTIRQNILECNDSILVSQWKNFISLKQQLLALEDNDSMPESIAAYYQQADSLEKVITRSSSVYRENQAMWKITWDSVQSHLSFNEVAIEYFSAPLLKDSTMYCALLLRQDSEYPELIPLFKEKEVSSFLSTSEGNITNQTYDYYSNGDTISQLVWSKILPYINEGETIYFAPSGLLHQLAIEYLPYDENRTMSDVYNMVRLSSTREIVLNKQHAEYTTATIYGGIAYDLEEDVLLAESENYATENLLASRSIENDTLNRGNVKYLPGTKKEAESINALLKQNNISAKLYTTAKANEESFKSLSGKHNNILHIGTHGFTWTDSLAKKQDFFAQRVQLMGQEQHYDTSIDPLNRCGLLFAGANIALQGNSKNLPEGVQDGILTAKEISLMDLRDANLVVLSACETAKGDITSEGVFGLQRAFKMAGVQTIIMSLWKVNDQATQLLMTEFYNNWIGKHQSKREAFRNAQNTVRTRYEEPEYWAGFVMLD